MLHTDDVCPDQPGRNQMYLKNKVMRVRGDTFGELFIQKILQNQLFLYFNEIAKLSKVFKDNYFLFRRMPNFIRTFE